jgi:hypothetical protein
VSSYWSTLGIIFGLFLIIDGFIGWLLGIYYSDPSGAASHPVLYPLGKIALIVGPIVLIIGIVILFASILNNRRKRSVFAPTTPPKGVIGGPNQDRNHSQEDKVEEAAHE